MSVLSHAARLPNFARRFGLYQGTTLWLQFAVSQLKLGQYLKVNWHGTEISLNAYSRSDYSIFWQVIICQQYDIASFPQSAALIAKYHELVAIGRSPLIIDAGANIGLSALWFAHTFPEATIIAIEPDPDSFRLLTKNLASLGERAVAVHAGLWNRVGKLHLANPESGASARRVTDDENTNAEIPAIDMPTLLSDYRQFYPIIMKIDIEGSQHALFSDHPSWAQDIPLFIIELEDWLFPWTGNSINFFRTIARHNFDYLIKGENIFCFNHNIIE